MEIRIEAKSYDIFNYVTELFVKFVNIQFEILYRSKKVRYL